ncbi:MAG: tyrosine-protein phosphatase [Erysipelotrichales bacterium]|nr:tyrosine-protein phosphatase [Erysipelotrichales bacterium]
MRIELEGLPNTRDLGGLKTKDGRTIKHKKLLRSGQLHFATEKDKEILLNDYNLGIIVDFRSLDEKEEKPDPTLSGVKYFYNPVMREITKGITRDEKSDKDTIKMIIIDMADDLERAEKYMEEIYESLINDDYALSQYGKFIDLLIENKNKASLWHCTAGKDRAGFATFLVLECLGVDKETIIEDYLLTNKYVQKDVETMVNVINKEYNLHVDDVVKALFGIKRIYLENIYDTIEKKYGNMREFLKEKINVTDEKIKILQDLFLE